jgi:hypothetical protein
MLKEIAHIQDVPDFGWKDQLLRLEFRCPGCDRHWGLTLQTCGLTVKDRIGRKPELANCFSCRVSRRNP